MWIIRWVQALLRMPCINNFCVVSPQCESSDESRPCSGCLSLCSLTTFKSHTLLNLQSLLTWGIVLASGEAAGSKDARARGRTPGRSSLKLRMHGLRVGHLLCLHACITKRRYHASQRGCIMLDLPQYDRDYHRLEVTRSWRLNQLWFNDAARLNKEGWWWWGARGFRSRVLGCLSQQSLQESVCVFVCTCVKQDQQRGCACHKGSPASGAR